MCVCVCMCLKHNYRKDWIGEAVGGYMKGVRKEKEFSTMFLTKNVKIF